MLRTFVLFLNKEMFMSNFLLMKSMVTTVENEDMDCFVRSVQGMDNFLCI